MRPDPHVAGLYPLHDPDWRAKLLHAGRLVWVPFVGWPMLLGYRRSLITHIASGQPAAMPEWHGAHRTHLANGLKAMLVIQVYLAPVSLALIGLLHSRGYSPGAWAAGLTVLCVAFPLFSSPAIPVIVVLATTGFLGERYLAPGEALLFVTTFAGVVFLLPAAFIRVATAGRYRYAFDLHRTLPFVVRHLPAYLAAWWYGTWMNGIALIAFVVAPWTLFWGYVASAVLFSQVALEDDANEALPSDADLVRIVKTPWFSVPLPDANAP